VLVPDINSFCTAVLLLLVSSIFCCFNIVCKSWIVELDGLFTSVNAAIGYTFIPLDTPGKKKRTSIYLSQSRYLFKKVKAKTKKKN